MPKEMKLWRKCAKQGNSYARYLIADAYEQKGDNERAVKHFLKLVGDDDWAVRAVTRIFRIRIGFWGNIVNITNDELLEGFPNNFMGGLYATDLIGQSARMGDCMSMAYLAMIWSTGWEIGVDHISRYNAYGWFKAAIAHGHPAGQLRYPDTHDLFVSIEELGYMWWPYRKWHELTIAAAIGHDETPFKYGGSVWIGEPMPELIVPLTESEQRRNIERSWDREEREYQRREREEEERERSQSDDPHRVKRAAASLAAGGAVGWKIGKWLA